jgi:hypothetical protein
MLMILFFTACTRWDGLAAKNALEQYCKLDYEGARIGGHNDLNKQYSALTAWEAEPGWDEVAIISSYIIGDPRRAGRIAVVDVVYYMVGRFTGEEYVQVAAVQEKNTYQVALTSTGWKIKSGLVPPHVSVSEFILHLQKLLDSESSSQRREKLQSQIEQLRSNGY